MYPPTPNPGAVAPPTALPAPARRQDHAARIRRHGDWPLPRCKAAILKLIATGPRSLGELTWLALNSQVRAATRDEAIAELLRDGLVRLATVPSPFPGQKPLTAVALASDREGVARG